VAVLLGFIVASAFGSADFYGGRASERAPTTSVLLVGQGTAASIALITALVVGAHVRGLDFVYGALAGMTNVCGLGFLYSGLARARAGVVAPLTAVVAALVPVGWGLVTGERPSAVVLVGAACAVMAGALIAREHSTSARENGTAPRRAAGVGHAVAAGSLFGSAIVLLAETANSSGFWPIFMARATGFVLMCVAVAVLTVRRGRVRVERPVRMLAAGVGAIDVAGTLLLLVAIRHGLLVVVAPVVALAPAFTVVLSWFVLHEHVTRPQLAGLALALVGLVLVASG
jgi:drug/metabolite transporter (DMT)-like permease